MTFKNSELMLYFRTIRDTLKTLCCWLKGLLTSHLSLKPKSLNGLPPRIGTSLHDLITDDEIDVCSHIFHILVKTVEWTTSRNCLPFCHLISRILKLKDVHPLEDKQPYPKPSPINIRILHANMSHTKKSTKQESHAALGSSSSTSHACDEQLDNIMATLQEINTKIFELATIMHS